MINGDTVGILKRVAKLANGGPSNKLNGYLSTCVHCDTSTALSPPEQPASEVSFGAAYMGVATGSHNLGDSDSPSHNPLESLMAMSRGKRRSSLCTAALRFRPDGVRWEDFAMTRKEEACGLSGSCKVFGERASFNARTKQCFGFRVP